MPLTNAQLQKILPQNKETVLWTQLLNEECPKYGINTPKRLAMFIAQCAHESAQFRILSENLNYSATALMSVFKKYFSDGTAYTYARQPERIANKVYANRMGNGPESSGDGYKYRGRGLIQLTGKNNYKDFCTHLGLDFTKFDPSTVATDKRLALKCALWFWSKNNLNRFADADDLKGCTLRINGGTHGIAERLRYYNDAKRALV